MSLCERWQRLLRQAALLLHSPDMDTPDKLLAVWLVLFLRSPSPNALLLSSSMFLAWLESHECVDARDMASTLALWLACRRPWPGGD